MFRWCTQCEMIPVAIHQALTTVEGLKRGRTSAKETLPVHPVPEAAVEQVLPHVCPHVAAMIQVQRLTGMRSGELCIMRPCDIDRAGTASGVWIYRPSTHKTAHHGHQRIIPIGPKARKILEPLLPDDLKSQQAFIFSPLAARQSVDGKKRTTRGRGGQRRRGPGLRYTVGSYRRAISRACDDAFGLPEDLERQMVGMTAWAREFWRKHKRPARLAEMPPNIRQIRDQVEEYRAGNRWFPHQLRHNAATELRLKFGIEAARIVLGHKSVSTTEIYTAQDTATAARIMSEVG